jgi:hypothetical protein
VRAVLCAFLSVALAAVLAQPVMAAPGDGDDVWSEWEIINQQNDRSMVTMNEIHTFTRDLVTRLFQVARSLIDSGSARTVLDIIEILIRLAEASGDRFAWVYRQSLDDMRRFFGDGSTWTGAWFGKESKRTSMVMANAIEERMQSGNSSRTTETGLEQTRTIAEIANTRRDLREGARMAWNAGEELGRQATNIPSTRAGVQALLAGQAAMLKSQAVVIQGIGQRMNAIATQNSVVSQQLHAANQNLKQVADGEQRRAEIEEQGTQQAMEMAAEAISSTPNTLGVLMEDTLGVITRYRPFRRR